MQGTLVLTPRATFRWRGHTVTVRALTPADVPAYTAFLERVDPEDHRMRLLGVSNRPALDSAQRLLERSGRQTIAFAAVLEEALPCEAILAVIRGSVDADEAAVEFGVLVRSDRKGQGLGKLLLGYLLEWARDRGMRELWGETLPYNDRLLGLTRRFDFDAQWDPERGLTRVRLLLAEDDLPPTREAESMVASALAH